MTGPGPDQILDTSVFDALTDMFVVIGGDLIIRYANPFAADLLGLTTADLVGASIVDFVHPDDLVRAFEVTSTIAGGHLGVPVTPAVYRLLRRDGSWFPVEINGARYPVDGEDGEAGLLMVGRYSGDNDLTSRILELLTGGAPIGDAVALIPGFGTWRHPDDHYAVVYRDEHRAWTVAGTHLSRSLIEPLIEDDASPWAVAATTGEEVRVPTAQLGHELRAIAEGHGLLGCWAVPVDDPRHPDPAVLVTWSRSGGPSMTVHRYSMDVMARALRLVLQWRRQLLDLEHAARFDALTGTANRRRFLEVLGQLAPRPSTRLAVLFVDLDGFKAVNDNFGHTVGDQVLREVAARLSAAIGPEDTVGRLGGDEFAVICPHITDDAEATTTAAAVIAAVGHPVAVGELTVQVGACVGIATTDSPTATPFELLERADAALYLAKAVGRDSWHLA